MRFLDGWTISMCAMGSPITVARNRVHQVPDSGLRRPAPDYNDTTPDNEPETDQDTLRPPSHKASKQLHQEMERQIRLEQDEIFLAQTIEDAKPERKQLLRLGQRRRKKQHRQQRSAEIKREKCKVLHIEATHQLKAYMKSEDQIRNLNRKLVQLKGMASDALEHYDDTENVHALGDVHSEPFKLNRGTNKSARATDQFSPERVAEIVSKVRIGVDLDEEQLLRVQSLVQTFSDIFALTLSEVTYVDWHSHHLSVDPSVKLPKRMSQGPVTKNQEPWFHGMLDAMEDTYIIQKVPGEFIKCLNSTNLAPKDKGKTG